jgi:hypothetical protein
VLLKLKTYGFDDHNLMIAATHTHSAFTGYDRRFISRLLFGSFNEELLDFTADKITAAVKAAFDSMKESRIESGSKKISGMNRSRFDPAFIFGERKNAEIIKPDPEKYKVDDKLTVLKCKDSSGKISGVMIHFTAHPTILSNKNMEISADYAGVLCRKVEEHIGQGIAMFLNGTLGDTAPAPDWEDDVRKEISQMNEYGEKLASHVIEIMNKADEMNIGRVISRTASGSFSKVILRKLNRIRLPDILSRAFYLKPQVPFQAFFFGKMLLIAIPAELTTAVGEKIKKICPDDREILIIAPANDYIGYAVTAEEYKTGGYASDSCFFGKDISDEFMMHISESLNLDYS